MGRHLQLARQVEADIAFFEDLVSGDAPETLEGLAKARLVLVQSVNAYLAHLAPLVSIGNDQERLRPWREAYAEAAAMRATYSQHIGRFSASTIQTQWEEYRRSCRDLIDGMRSHLAEVTSWKAID
ncbi:hypothetical protein [Sphingomonas sp. CLY1604]|uniref:hypothetical protein n=1 Tax=Sphingomonas sp. CLY1604 TaxID=3457786 RepID=UPI003FD7CED5